MQPATAIMVWDFDAGPVALWADVVQSGRFRTPVDGAADHKKLLDDRTFTVTADIVADTPYYFVILATKGQDSSDWSKPASGRTDAVAPAPPMNLDASSRGESVIWLTWMASAEGTDVDEGGSPTGYTIRYRRGTSSTLRTISIGNVTEYAHTGLNSNTEYFYSIRAHNSGGDSEWHPDPTGGADNGGTAPTEAIGQNRGAATGRPVWHNDRGHE